MCWPVFMGCNDVEINTMSSGQMDLQSPVGAMLACLHQRPSLFFVSIVHMQQCKIMSKSIKQGFYDALAGCFTLKGLF